MAIPTDPPTADPRTDEQRRRNLLQEYTRPVPVSTGRPFARDDEQNKGTNPMPTFARRPSTMSSLIPVVIPQNPMVGQQRQQNIGAAIPQIPYSTVMVMLEDTIQESGDYLL